MSVFDNLAKPAEGTEPVADRMSGGGFQPLPSDIYMASIKACHQVVSAKGSCGFVVVLDVDGREVNFTSYVTTNSEHPDGVKCTYTDKKTKKEVPLPNYDLMNSMALLASGVDILDIDTVPMLAKVWEGGKQVNKEVPMLKDLLDKKVLVGLLDVIEDKTANDGTGKYVPTGEVRKLNEADKFFNPDDKRTVAEMLSGATEAAWYDAWLKQHKGKVIDNSTGVKPGQAAGVAGAPPSNAATAAAGGGVASVFAKK